MLNISFLHKTFVHCLQSHSLKGYIMTTVKQLAHNLTNKSRNQSSFSEIWMEFLFKYKRANNFEIMTEQHSYTHTRSLLVMGAYSVSTTIPNSHKEQYEIHNFQLANAWMQQCNTTECLWYNRDYNFYLIVSKQNENVPKDITSQALIIWWNVKFFAEAKAVAEVFGANITAAALLAKGK